VERVNFCQDLPLTKKEPNWKRKKKKERKRKRKSPAISVLLIESKFIQ